MTLEKHEHQKFDNLINKIEKNPKFATEIFATWLLTQKDKEILKKEFHEYVKTKIFEISDNIPNSIALNNDFFKTWLSDDKLSPKQVRDILLNYLALTDLTRHAVAMSYLTSHGDIKAETDVSKNLYEESGEGREDKAHIELLRNSISEVLKAIGEEGVNLGKIGVSSPLILEATKDAMRKEGDLYTGKFIGNNLLDNLILGEYSLDIKCGTHAVSAAHEGKAPGMLIKLLEGLTKYVKDATNNKRFREYFDIHLGEDIVDKILSGEKISKKLITENKELVSWSSEQLREKGYVEQAHRKDANDSTIAMIMSKEDDAGNKTNLCDNVLAFIAAKKGFELFIAEHGKFWDNLYNEIIENNHHSHKKLKKEFQDGYCSDDEVYNSSRAKRILEERKIKTQHLKKQNIR